jgi:cell fate regulator YaaT (PSP1 superfamily)
MEDVLGVRFQEAGKIYYFSAAGYNDLSVGEYVVVETSRGQELARIVIAPGQVVSVELTEPLKPITRVAYDDDVEQAERLRGKAEAEVELARQKASAANLPIKLFSGSYDLEGKRLTLLFLSEDRVDFRDLVRDVSAATGAQVQLRQVGPRDQAKVVGGYGRCGRRLCCSSWLISFPAISIKMAKEQDLPLNPSKISGQCGRLLCCLSYENDMYREVKQSLPRPGTYVSTPSGNARVLSVNVPRGTVTMQMETLQVVDVPIQDMGMDQGLIRILSGPPAPAIQPGPRTAQPAVETPVAPMPPRGRDRGGPRGRGERRGPNVFAGAQPSPAPKSEAPAPNAVVPAAAATGQPTDAAAPGPARRTAGHRRRRRRGGAGQPPQTPK